MIQPIVSSGARFTRLNRALALALVLCALPCSAFAYLDPGSGSLLIQALLALLFTFAGLFKRVRSACAAFLRKFIGRRRPDEN